LNDANEKMYIPKTKVLLNLRVEAPQIHRLLQTRISESKLEN